MASTPVTLTIDLDTLTLDGLGEIVSAFTAYLAQVDLSESSSGKRTLTYRVTALSYSSPALLSAVAEPRDDVADTGPAVLSKAIRAVAQVARGERPPGFRDEALEALRTLADYGNGQRGIRIDAPTLSLRALITKSVATQAERVLAQNDGIGSIEGHLDTISVHGQPYFTLFDAVSGRGVRCYFDSNRLADVIAALGKKVIAHGRLRRDPRGAPREMRDLDYFDVMGGAEGSIDNLPGVFAGLDVKSYLRAIRRG